MLGRRAPPFPPGCDQFARRIQFPKSKKSVSRNFSSVMSKPRVQKPNYSPKKKSSHHSSALFFQHDSENDVGRACAENHLETCGVRVPNVLRAQNSGTTPRSESATFFGCSLGSRPSVFVTPKPRPQCHGSSCFVFLCRMCQERRFGQPTLRVDQQIPCVVLLCLAFFCGNKQAAVIISRPSL